MPSKYNIDALRNKDGSYRFARYRFITGALTAGHTTHLRTERGTVAMRPYEIKEVRINQRTGEPYFPGEKVGRNWLVEFCPTGGSHDDAVKLYTHNRNDAARFVFKHLNGFLNSYTAGDSVDIWSNQNWREGTVLAVIDDQALIEYDMPSGSTSLRINRVIGHHFVGAYRTPSYRTLPKKWIAAMHEQGTSWWMGLGQREREPVPFPVNA